MKNLLALFQVIVLLTAVQIQGITQVNPTSHSTVVVEATALHITKNKTTNIIFPQAIVSVDRGSADVLVQKASGAENILQVKAGKENFEESNLTVLTADSRLYSFVVTYVKAPVQLNITFTPASNADWQPTSYPRISKVLFYDESTKVETAIDHAARIALKKNKGWIAKTADYKMELYVSSIYIKNDIIYLNLLIRNLSNLGFDVEGFRFSLQDRNKVRRTASQEVYLNPIAIHGDVNKVPKNSSVRTVVAFSKFIIPKGKYLNVELNETDGGRSLSVKVRKNKLVRAKSL